MYKQFGQSRQPFLLCLPSRSACVAAMCSWATSTMKMRLGKPLMMTDGCTQETLAKFKWVSFLLDCLQLASLAMQKLLTAFHHLITELIMWHHSQGVLYLCCSIHFHCRMISCTSLAGSKVRVHYWLIVQFVYILMLGFPSFFPQLSYTNYPYSGPAEPVRLLRPWPDQFLRHSKIFRAATCSCRLEICVLVACKLSAGDARLM